MKLLSRLFRRRTTQKTIAARPAFCERLEERQLMALMTITQVVADNRGQVLIQLSKAPDITTVTRSSVQMYTAGPDGKLVTADDTFVSIALHFSPSINRITINANLPANTPYRIKIVGSRMKAQDGTFLDGEYKGAAASGNGVQGGNFEMQAVPDPGTVLYARLSTTKGVITMQLLRSLKPISVANFLFYANSGKYDNIVVTRDPAPKPFIVQMGSIQLTSNNTLVAPPHSGPIVNEFTTNGIIHNTLGTVSFARQSGVINSATNQFFFNVNNNTTNLDNQPSANNGFTVFARVANAASLATLNTIEGLDTVTLNNPFSGHGVVGPFTGTDLLDVPVNDKSVYAGNISTEITGVTQSGFTTGDVVTGNFNASQQLVIIGRTAVLMKTGALVVAH